MQRFHHAGRPDEAESNKALDMLHMTAKMSEMILLLFWMLSSTPLLLIDRWRAGNRQSWWIRRRRVFCVHK